MIRVYDDLAPPGADSWCAVPTPWLTKGQRGRTGPPVRLSNLGRLLHAPRRQPGDMMHKSILLLSMVCLAAQALAQSSLPPVPAPQMVPQPGPVTKGPYQPQAILPGGIVMPLYPAGSPFLNAKRVSEAEKYTMDPLTPGRVQRIVYVHNPAGGGRGAGAGGAGAAGGRAPGGGRS